jgi:hypothetical protein
MILRVSTIYPVLPLFYLVACLYQKVMFLYCLVLCMMGMHGQHVRHSSCQGEAKL